jgi:protein involved in polysaccharide export with SLBB domain
MKTRSLVLALLFATSLVPLRAQQQSAPPPAGPIELVPDESGYRLSPGDTLDIKFLHNPELNEQVQIRPDGFISMPLVGEMNVARLTVGELVAALTKKYDEVLRAPDVTVQIRGYGNRHVYVGGEVARPGMLQLGGRQTALDAVMEAGGLKASSNRSELVVLRRSESDQPRVIHLSMKSTKGAAPEASAFQLQPLDVVLVSESGISKAGRTIDQYVRQMSPFILTAGFSWLFGSGPIGIR